jgi:hypothetical protein
MLEIPQKVWAQVRDLLCRRFGTNVDSEQAYLARSEEKARNASSTARGDTLSLRKVKLVVSSH